MLQRIEITPKNVDSVEEAYKYCELLRSNSEAEYAFRYLAYLVQLPQQDKSPTPIGRMSLNRCASIRTYLEKVLKIRGAPTQAERYGRI